MKYSNRDKTLLIHEAMRMCNLDGHVKNMMYKKDAGTWAEKIAAQFHTKGGLPVKNSYMYCTALDMCFFYDRAMTPMVTYAGYMVCDCTDVENVPAAFEKAGEVLEVMRIVKCNFDNGARLAKEMDKRRKERRIDNKEVLK